MDTYPLVNRCAVVVIPQAPFWTWVNKLGDLMGAAPIQQQNDSNIYLLPDYESADDIYLAMKKYLDGHFEDIFISELEAWSMDPLTFPEITYDRFSEWFRVSSHTMIFDTVKKPLKRE